MIMKFKRLDQVKLIGENLAKAGYNVDELLDSIFLITNIFPKENYHHYKLALLKKGVYTKEELDNKEVYSINCRFNNKSIIVNTIDDDMCLVESYKPTPIKVSKDIINDILKAYVQFHIDYDLKTDCGDILNDINGKTMSKGSKRTLINIISDVDQLPCIDSLYDKYMSKEANEWLSNNEDFSLEEYLNK